MISTKTRRIKTAGVTAALLIGGALVALPVLYGLLGFTPFRSVVEHPPCDQLPDVATVQAALSSHPELVRDLTAQGRDVTVGVGRPCEGRRDVGLIEIRHSPRKTGLKAIEGVLNSHLGFGVPVIVRKS